MSTTVAFAFIAFIVAVIAAYALASRDSAGPL